VAGIEARGFILGGRVRVAAGGGVRRDPQGRRAVPPGRSSPSPPLRTIAATATPSEFRPRRCAKAIACCLSTTGARPGARRWRRER
jgi:hypothetical protein